MDDDWLIYRGTTQPHNALFSKLPPPPQWRAFGGEPVVQPKLGAETATARRVGALARAAIYQPGSDEVELINAALYLRRPLLVTGKPGTGKSTLAYSVSRELKLGPVLSWPITSRSSRLEGLYQYDALARLQDASLRRDSTNELGLGQNSQVAPGADHDSGRGHDLDIGRYIRLGPLGTALLPYKWPRVLLIDELDKSDIDLPNDLLTLFEEGEYEIRELSRIARDQPTARVLIHDGTDHVEIAGGKVRCNAFPLVVITSNGEREFPPAFMRRCLRLEIMPPSPERLADIVGAHLGPEAVEICGDLIDTFVSRRQNGDLATDQLLNAIFLTYHHAWEGDKDRLVKAVMRYLQTSES